MVSPFQPRGQRSRAAEASPLMATAEAAERLPLLFGSPAFTVNGRLLVSHRPMFETGTCMSEVVAPAELRPLPDLHWNDPAASADQRLEHVGCDGIMLDHRSEWLHHGSACGGASCRAWVTDFLDQGLPDAELAAPVKRCASRPNAGGYAINAEGNLYMTELGGHAIGMMPAVGRACQRLAEHPRRSWPDKLTWEPDGMLYVAVSQLSLNGGTWGEQPPHPLGRVAG